MASYSIPPDLAGDPSPNPLDHPRRGRCLLVMARISWFWRGRLRVSIPWSISLPRSP